MSKEKAVIYARYSSDRQREESIAAQLRECKEYAKRNKISIIGEYCDHALTGTTDKRPEFQKMIKDSAKGLFSLVIVWKIDRFARNRYDSAIYKARLKKNGVRVISAKESIPEGPEGILLESMMEGYAEYYSANLSQNVKRGMYESALSYKTLGYKVFGLKANAEDRFIPDPETAPAVKKVFTDYIAGHSSTQIAKELNESGCRTARGNKFTVNSIRKILKNEKYIGVYRFRDIVNETAIEPIIDKETFCKAQKMLERHKLQPAAKKVEGGYLLTGKLFCGLCGENMTAYAGTSRHGKLYRYYICNNKRRHKCQKEKAPKEWIEDLIVKAIIDVVNTDNFIENVADAYMIWQDKQTSAPELKTLQNRLKIKNAAIQNILAVIDSGGFTESVRQHLLSLESEKAELEMQIDKAQIQTPHIKRDEIVSFLLQFRNGDIDSFRYRLWLIETFLQAAYLYEDNIIITFNYMGKDNKLTLPIINQAKSKGKPMGSNLGTSGRPNKANLNLLYMYNNIIYIQIRL